MSTNLVVRIKYSLPDIPADQWSDVRAEFEKTHSLVQVSKVFMCDPRTVSRCLQFNLSSTELGCQIAPRKLDPYRKEIEQEFARMLASPDRGKMTGGICRISREITERIRKHGYTGSERIVRNYIQQHCLLISKEGDNKNDHH